LYNTCTLEDVFHVKILEYTQYVDFRNSMNGKFYWKHFM